MKRLLLTTVFWLAALAMMAQVPAGFNYQAVVRNSSGEIVANQTVKFRISILQNSGVGTAVYVETHSVPTGNFGLANFVVGLGNRLSGSLDPAGWGNNPHFLKVELDPDNGDSFSHLGTIQLLAVPYAFHAKTVEIEKDDDPTNEIQVLSLSGLALSLSRGGGSVTLPSAEGDNWGSEYVHADATLAGQGTPSSPLKMARQSATTGQVLKWNGTTWTPATDETGSGGSNPTGPAGGDLSGTYPNPTIGAGKVIEEKIADNAVTSAKIAGNAVTSAKIADGTITAADLANNAITEAKIASGAVTAPKLASMGAAAGQVLKYTGTVWAPGNDNAGGEFTLPFDKTGNVTGAAFKITNSNNATESVAINGVSTAGYGVKGESTQGRGVYGRTTALNNVGVVGVSDNPSSTNGTGVWGETNSSQGAGVKGLAYSQTGSGIGVVGMSNAQDGTAIYGYSYSKTGIAHGVHGVTASTNGYGVYGLAPTYGVRGEASAVNGIGVYGKGSHGGVYGSGGFGVIGTSNHSDGIGIYGIQNNSNGYSGFFSGGKFYVQGKVGLGTTTPTQQLSVGNGLDLYSGDVNSPTKPSIRGGGDHLMINAKGSTGILAFNYDGGSGEVWFNKGTTQLMRITQAGHVGMGSGSPGARLHVAGTGFPDSFIFIQSNAGQDAGIRLYEGSTVKWHIFNNSAVAGLQIYNFSGNIAIFAKQSNAYVGLGTTNPTQKLHVVGNAYKTEGGTSWAASSDERLKTLLGKYEKGLDEIAALEAVWFVYKEDNARELSADVEQSGFVAQEVRKIFPEAVSEAEDGYLDFNMHPINVALVNAVKELKAENDLLKARLDMLEQKLGAMAGK